MTKTSKMRQALFSSFILAAVGLCGPVMAGTYDATQDTYLYEFLGNQGGGSGESGGLLIWNHESIHGGQALIQFDPTWMMDAALAGPFTATLNLYAYCSSGGFVGGCPGDPGAETTTTDVVIQRSVWDEADGSLSWGELDNAGTSVSFSQSGADGWISIDVTSLIQVILDTGVDFGFVLSQEAYPVIRTDEGSVAVSAFCDSELSSEFCSGTGFTPYLEINATPVPVPAAVWLFATALGSLGVMRRRKARD
ncbi:MAG: VPLPA-CTERM sorting domain-containing protein [Pseudomonadota bacterium]